MALPRPSTSPLRALLLAAALAVAPAVARPAAAQAQAAPAAGPAVGQLAPDFTLPGATRYGVLRDPVSLASLRGNTVVLAFFFKARTKG
ncbi:MAG TPA: hypothetical protein VFS05_02935 [Gemmatimonadaceae bacterium]|nr:hypothetical protein [Gemmatimonadaceae bacterium]